MKPLKLRLRTRIGLLGALVVIFSVVLGIVAYNQAVKIKLYALVNQDVVAIQFDVFRLTQSIEKLADSDVQLNMLPLVDQLSAKFLQITDSYVVSSDPAVASIKSSFDKQITALVPDVKSFSLMMEMRKGLQDSILHCAKSMSALSESIPGELQLSTVMYTKGLKAYLEQPSPIAYSNLDVIVQRIQSQSITLPSSVQLSLLGRITNIQSLTKQVLKIDAELGFDSRQGLRADLLSKLSIASLSVNQLYEVVNEVTEKSRSNAITSILISLLLLLIVLGLFIQHIVHTVAHPLMRIRNYMIKLVMGRLPEPLILKGSGDDGISEMAGYMNSFVQSLKDKAAFADEIGKGKLDARYELLSEDDILGNSLLEMEKSLQRAEQEDRKYKFEEQKRIWANEGVASFSEILRLNSHNLQVLADEIIRNLVKYLHAGLGGLYLKDEDENQTYLELIAAFAYDRKKFISQKINLGEGLVGTCAIEKLTVFITDLPEDYVRIRSGLGEAIPRSLLLVPLKLEDELLGVIELASFKVFDQQEIDFAEKIAESIASTISSVRINARTAELLAQSQKQAEEMAEQEEEMRQNIEEIQATQEESARREQQFQSVLSAFNHAIMVAELDGNGVVLSANEHLLEHTSVDRLSFVNRNISEWISLDEKTPEWRAALSKARNGQVATCMLPLRTNNGEDIWLACNLSPVLLSGGKVPKILMLLTDASAQVSTELKLQRSTEGLEKNEKMCAFYRQIIEGQSPVCEIVTGGQIDKVNALFAKFTALSETELLSRKITSLIAEASILNFENNLKLAFKGNYITAEVAFASSEIKATAYSLLPIFNTEGNVTRVVMLCS